MHVLLKWLILTLKMRHVHVILREICPFKKGPQKGGANIGSIAGILLRCGATITSG